MTFIQSKTTTYQEVELEDLQDKIRSDIDSSGGRYSNKKYQITTTKGTSIDKLEISNKDQTLNKFSFVLNFQGNEEDVRINCIKIISADVTIENLKLIGSFEIEGGKINIRDSTIKVENPTCNISVKEKAELRATNVEFRKNENCPEKGGSTIYSEMSKVTLEKCKLFSSNYNFAIYVASSTLNCNNIEIEKSNDISIYSKELNKGSELNLVKFFGTNNNSSIVYTKSGHLRISNCSFSKSLKGLEAKESTVEVADSDFFEISQACILLESSKCKVTRGRFYEYLKGIIASNKCKLKVKNSIFEKARENHVYISEHSMLKVETSAFIHSDKEGFFINHNCVSVFIRCSFLDSKEEHIKCLIWCQVNILNCYLCDGKKASILLQGTYHSNITATTIENCRGGIYICDSSNDDPVKNDLHVISTTLRNIDDFGMLISCGMNVKISHSYFLKAKLKCQYGGSMRVSSSYFNTDPKEKKDADKLVEYCFRKKLQIESYCPQKILNEIDPDYIIVDTKRPVIIHNCMQWKYVFVELNLNTDSTVFYKDSNTLEENKKCLICGRDNAQYSFECGHTVCCEECLFKNKSFECPICLATITHVRNRFSNDECCQLCTHIKENGKANSVVIGIPCMHDACEKCAQEFLQSRTVCMFCGLPVIYKRMPTYK